jgi:hypothetical protein
MSTELLLPVSIGEGLDKLTILDIKREKITDSRRADCEKEYSVLYQKLEDYCRKLSWHYKILKEINLIIWNLQDNFHGKDVSEIEAGKICSEILKENDRRFRIKAKINHILSSNLREQKGYAKKKALFYGHLGMGDMFWLNGAVRYLSTCYDEVAVVVKERNVMNVQMMYLDDPSIKMFVIEDDYILYPFQAEKRKFLEGQGYEVFACGYHAENPRIYEFPHCFYDDLKLDRKTRESYFYVPYFAESLQMYIDVATTNPSYILVHQQSSSKRMPIWEMLIKQHPTDLILDINENHYPEGHPYHTVAEKVVNKPLLHYKILLEKAKGIHLLESSFYCFATHLDLSSVQEKICYDAFDHSNERLGVFKTGSLN